MCTARKSTASLLGVGRVAVRLIIRDLFSRKRSEILEPKLKRQRNPTLSTQLVVDAMLGKTGLYATMRSWIHSRTGNVAIITGIALPALVGFCGLGAETGYWYYRHRDLQSAADVTAYNAVMSLRSGADATDLVQNARSDAANNGWVSSQGTLTLRSPPISGANQNSRSVAILLTENEPRYFTSLFASGTVPISVRAVGTYAQPAPACMLGLDKKASRTVQFWGNADADFTNCNIVSDSIASDAFALGGSAKVTAPCVDAVGGDYVTASLTLTSCAAVTTNSPYVPDPYASVPAPLVSPTCASGPTNGVLSPGRYCDGLSLSGNVTVQPGVYVVSGGAFKINSNAAISGNGVTFYLTNNATMQVNGNATLTLTAPTTGTYSGILFFGDRSMAYADQTFNGTATTRLTGALYFPSQNIELLGNFSGSGGCMQVIGDTIYYTGSATFSTSCPNSGMASINVPGNVSVVE